VRLASQALLLGLGLGLGLGWPCCGAAALASAAAAASLPALDGAMRAWRDHHEPRLGVEHDYGPFVFVREDGVVDGLSIDMLRLLQARTGLRLRPLPAQPLSALLAAARRHELDLLSSLRPTPERALFLDFTQPYVSVPAVLVGRAGDAPRPLSALAGRPVAVGQGYAVEAVMRQRHPQVQWQAVPDDLVALQGVVAGRYSAAVLDAASMAFIVRRHGLQGLALQSQVGFDYTLSFAVRRDWPQLTMLLNAGIQSLSQAERQAVLARWLPAADPVPARAPTLTRLALGLLLLAVLLALLPSWRRWRAGPRA